ncbi:MAG TPA: hypothetical protein DD730_14900 [Desulfosporosinus sp.]|nr:hypothetical protein [Desulfosporosinus sp.]
MTKLCLQCSVGELGRKSKRFCSFRCYWNYLKGKASWNKGIPCSDLKKEKLRKANLGKKQSLETIEKRVSQYRGDKHYMWKDGITPENVKIRNSTEMRLWKKACMERDNFTCQKTGERGGVLVVHHINNFADFPEFRTSIKNGITLSVESHEEFHRIYGKKNNTREQLMEFLNKNI